MHSHRSTTSLLRGLAGLTLLLLLAGSGSAPAGEADSNDKIKGLLQNRLAPLTEAHELLLKAFQSGDVQLGRVLEARTALLRAKLDLSETNEERIKVYEGMVKTAEELLGSTKKLAEAKQATRADVLQAEAHLLEARIGLAKAKATRTSLGEELQVGKRYLIVPVGKDFAEQGTLVEVLAVDKGWVKVKSFLPEPRHVWINLSQVGAIKTTEAVPRDIRPDPEAIEASGEITYDETRMARLCAGVPGTVGHLEKAVGQPVRQKDLLAVVNAPEAGKAKAAFMQALAEAEAKGKALERLRTAGEAVPARAVLEAEVAQRQAQAGLGLARQALLDLGLPIQMEELKGMSAEEVGRRVQFLGLPEEFVKKLDPKAAPANLVALRAPLDGVVVARQVVVGEGVDGLKTLFVVADTRRMWLTLQVPLADAGRLALGQAVRFRADGDTVDLEGRITWISTAVNERTRTVTVRADLANPEGRLRANTPGKGRIGAK